MRIDKYLANLGVGTRSEVKIILKKGRVKVNGTAVKDAGLNINENDDEITVDGNVLNYEEFYYLKLYKPAGYVTSAHEKNQKVVMELINEPFKDKLFPVGRLDKDTTGLLLLTNDGQLSHRLLSPSKHVDKSYLVTLRDNIEANYIEAFNNGIDIGDDKDTLPADLKITGPNICIVTIHEGRFHQIKRMFEALGNEVIMLHRISLKNLLLDEDMKPGDYRRLSETELKGLMN